MANKDARFFLRLLFFGIIKAFHQDFMRKSFNCNAHEGQHIGAWKMKKAELVKKISEMAPVMDAKLSKKEVELVLDAVIAEFKDILVEGGVVALKDIGTLSVKSRGAREGRNPRTGETLHIEACKAVVFKQSSVIKAALNVKPVKAEPAKKAVKKAAKK